ncbi:MAG TPA: CpXC domain-containing protein [Nitrospirota bacterium]|nr:CpXC domain-containing protein [Nitrospirota bacterium]
MSTFLVDQSEAHGYETLRCARCSRDFKAQVVTWVDASKSPQARTAILQLKFNVFRCSHCGSPNFADVLFFYEDFAEGLLIAVFPRNENSGAEEVRIRERYGYYPHLAYLDMTQLWLLVYLQGFYRESRRTVSFADVGNREKQTLRLLHFLACDPVMATIKNKLDDIFSGTDGEETNLAAVLGQAVYRVEGLHPWPLDRRCICKADITTGLACCGRPVDFENHAMLSPGGRGIECPRCGKTIAHVVCERCGRSYTWELGVVATLEGGEDIEHLSPRGHGSSPHTGG